MYHEAFVQYVLLTSAASTFSYFNLKFFKKIHSSNRMITSLHLKNSQVVAKSIFFLIFTLFCFALSWCKFDLAELYMKVHYFNISSSKLKYVSSSKVKLHRFISLKAGLIFCDLELTNFLTVLFVE